MIASYLFVVIGLADTKQGAHRDETPPRTPTGNAPSSESDIEVSSPSNELVSSSNDLVVSQEEDERLAKELSLKEAAAHDLSHRPKRRRFHESYNFNMKCPTPGCNSLGEDWVISFVVILHYVNKTDWIRGSPPLSSLPSHFSPFFCFLFLPGHLTGRHERHFSISGCPLYHNLSADECKVQITHAQNIEEAVKATFPPGSLTSSCLVCYLKKPNLKCNFFLCPLTFLVQSLLCNIAPTSNHVKTVGTPPPSHCYQESRGWTWTGEGKETNTPKVKLSSCEVSRDMEVVAAVMFLLRKWFMVQGVDVLPGQSIDARQTDWGKDAVASPGWEQTLHKKPGSSQTHRHRDTNMCWSTT